MNQLEDWNEPVATTPATLEAMDALIAEYVAARDDYDRKKEESNKANAVKDELKDKVIAALKANGRSKYDAPELGLVYISSKEVYPTPKTTEDKAQLFTYIQAKYGPQALLGLQSIHSATLTAWANKEAESGVMKIPGLEAPTMQETLNYRRS